MSKAQKAENQKKKMNESTLSIVESQERAVNPSTFSHHRSSMGRTNRSSAGFFKSGFRFGALDDIRKENKQSALE